MVPEIPTSSTPDIVFENSTAVGNITEEISHPSEPLLFTISEISKPTESPRSIEVVTGTEQLIPTQPFVVETEQPNTVHSVSTEAEKPVPTRPLFVQTQPSNSGPSITRIIYPLSSRKMRNPSHFHSIPYYSPKTKPQRPSPVVTYRFGSDYPHDHIDDYTFRRKSAIVINEETKIIQSLAQQCPYRAEFYEHYLDNNTNQQKRSASGIPNYSIPLSVKKRQIRGLMTSVVQSPTGECDGCSRKNPISIHDTGAKIRKFVGNTEVPSIITSNNRFAFCTSSFVAVYPSAHTPFNVTVVSVTRYPMFSLSTLVQIVFFFFLKFYLDGQDTIFWSLLLNGLIDLIYLINSGLYTFLHVLLRLSIHSLLLLCFPSINCEIWVFTIFRPLTS